MAQQVMDFNRRASQSEQLTSRSIMTAGATWPGVMLPDNLRTLTTWRPALRSIGTG